MALAQLGLYPPEELKTLFSSSAVVDEEGRVLRSIVYGNIGESKRDIAGGLLVQLIGMVSSESSYVPPIHPEDVEKMIRLQAHSDTPLEVRRGGRELAHLLDKRWVRVGLEIYDTLVDVVGGEDRVWETYVLPFTGIICYVVLVNEGVARPIHDTFKKQPLLSLKIFDKSEVGTLLAFYPTNGKFFRASHTKNGGARVTARLLAGVGATAAELEVLEDEDEVEEGVEQGETTIGIKIDREKIRQDVTVHLQNVGWSQMMK